MLKLPELCMCQSVMAGWNTELPFSQEYKCTISLPALWMELLGLQEPGRPVHSHRLTHCWLHSLPLPTEGKWHPLAAPAWEFVTGLEPLVAERFRGRDRVRRLKWPAKHPRAGNSVEWIQPYPIVFTPTMKTQCQTVWHLYFLLPAFFYLTSADEKKSSFVLILRKTWSSSQNHLTLSLLSH